MALYILKFGGTSVADLSRINRVADIARRYRDSGHQVLIVVSAMAGITDQLVGYTCGLYPQAPSAERDVVYASGEQVTAGLLALAFQHRRMQARSFLAWQIPIRTTAEYTNARITEIDPGALRSCLEQGVIPVVAGFQGVCPSGHLTTLGRGGSDTTAVALAVALQADYCDIYTDVDGVYSADPNLIPMARRHDEISYEEMFEMATAGAKVLQTRSVELAMQYQVHVRVLSSLIPTPVGTTIKEISVEKTGVKAVVHNTQEALVNVLHCREDLKSISAFLSAMAEKGYMFDLVNHTVTDCKTVHLTFTCKKSELNAIEGLLHEHKGTLGYREVRFDQNIAKITLVGLGLRANLEIPATALQTLHALQIPLYIMQTGEMKMSFVIPLNAMATAAEALHSAFGLDRAEAA